MANKQYFLSMYEKAVPDDLPFKEKLRLCKEFGFDGLEISIDASDWRLARLDWSKQEREALKRDMEETGCPIYSMCLSGHRKYPMGSLDKQTEERALDIMRKAVDLAADLGIRIIQLAGYDEYANPSTPETMAKFTNNLKYACELAAKKGVLMGFETMMDTECVNSVESAMRFVNACESVYLNVYPDIGNIKSVSLQKGFDVNDDLRKGKGHIVGCHLKETLPGQDRDVPFGTGHTEYDRNIPVLKELGVRYFNGEFWCKGDNWKIDGINSAKFLREKLDKVFND